jgi:predicted nucleic acid-binding protein
MPLVLVSDTSVLVDLQRGGVLETALRLPYEFAVPDLLFERELRAWDGLALEQQIAVLTLDADGVELAVGYRRTDTRLSLPDAFALALAKTGGHTLLAGDASLRAMADAEGVKCHGVLWVLDEIARCDLAPPNVLHRALTAMSEHPRCRLPRAEVRKRLEEWDQH